MPAPSFDLPALLRDDFFPHLHESQLVYFLPLKRCPMHAVAMLLEHLPTLQHVACSTWTRSYCPPTRYKHCRALLFADEVDAAAFEALAQGRGKGCACPRSILARALTSHPRFCANYMSLSELFYLSIHLRLS